MWQFEVLIKSKINGIARICDLIKINFETCEKEVCLHIQKALFRVIEYENLLISSWDMGIPSKNFKKKLFKRFKWDIAGNTLYDDEVRENEKKLLGRIVNDVIFHGKDLILLLENNLRLEIIADTLKSDYEIFRIFELNNLDSHYVVES